MNSFFLSIKQLKRELHPDITESTVNITYEESQVKNMCTYTIAKFDVRSKSRNEKYTQIQTFIFNKAGIFYEMRPDQKRRFISQMPTHIAFRRVVPPVI